MTRTDRIEVRCTPEEKKEWVEKAYPLTISQYVRYLLTISKVRGSERDTG